MVLQLGMDQKEWKENIFLKKSSKTPLMIQYDEIKSSYIDSILLFRMGDFYETFGDDATLAAELLGIVLTKRSNGKELLGGPLRRLQRHIDETLKLAKQYQIQYIPFGKKEPVTVELPALSGSKLQKRLVNRHSAKGKFKNFEFKWIEQNVGLLTINSFDFGLRKKGRQRYREFLKETFEAISEHVEAKHLIVDVRFNEGGYIGHDATLFSYLAHLESQQNSDRYFFSYQAHL